ncbi:hypothetical protein Q9189_005552 [Teloschistes chrysophthalmus]
MRLTISFGVIGCGLLAAAQYTPTLNIKVYNTSAVDKGSIFLAPHTGPAQGPYVFDQQGKTLYSIPNRLGNVFDFQPCIYQKTLRYCLFTTGSANIAKGYGNGTASIYDDKFQLIKGLPTSDYHEFKIQQTIDSATGAYSDIALLTLYNPVRRDLSQFGIANEDNQGWVIDCRLRALDPTSGKILFDWSALDHVPLSESLVKPTGAINGLTAAFAWDYFHMDSIARLYNGDFIVSSRHTSTIYRISGKDGSILWRLGGKSSTIQLQGFQFSSQHDVRVIKDSGSIVRLSMFDNAYNTFTPSQGDSSGKIIELDTATKTARLVQQYNPPESGFQSGDGGSLQLLPRGNVFICWGSTPYVTEHTADGLLVYSANYAVIGSSVSSYRAAIMPVYYNVTVYSNIYETLTHQSTMTLHQPIDRPITATVCSQPTAPQGAKTTFEPVSVIHPTNQLGSGAIAGIAVGAVAGSAMLLGMVWFAVRKWRQWKAKKSQRVQGVELQRAWEREEKTGRALSELAKQA